jgi:VanZ family protein
MKLSKQSLYILATFLWAGLIYFLSAQPDLKTSLPASYDLILRKIAHVFVFAVLTYLLAKTFTKHNKAVILLVIILAVFYAFSDEIHQLNVEGRYGSAKDILIDSIGVFLGIFYLRRKYYFKIFKK